MMSNQLQKMKTESLQSSKNLSKSLETEMNMPNLPTGNMQSSKKSTKMMPNQLQKIKTETLQSSENLFESPKTEMKIPNHRERRQRRKLKRNLKQDQKRYEETMPLKLFFNELLSKEESENRINILLAIISVTLSIFIFTIIIIVIGLLPKSPKIVEVQTNAKTKQGLYVFNL